MQLLNKRNAILLCGLVVLGGALYFVTPSDACVSIPTQTPAQGSQGYRVWEGPTLKSFEQGGRAVCVPLGWEPVGELRKGDGWALYERGTTGVIIRSDSWASITLTPKHSSYTVTVRYPVATPAKFIPLYVNIVGHAFTRAGELFGDAGTDTRVHTVLVTAGLAGNTIDDNSRVYPDTSARLTIFVRTPDQERGEGLFNHAVVHIYNRYRTDLTAYEAQQAPFKAGDWQEVEATWAESAFSTSDLGREDRMRYLYNVYLAVRNNNIGLVAGTPFDDPQKFGTIQRGAVVPEGSDEINYQYGHYIVSPLIMLATEGLLIAHKAPQHVEDILLRIHTGKVTTFLGQVGTLLPKTETDHIRSWIAGTETIPADLVMRAVDYYDTRSH